MFLKLDTSKKPMKLVYELSKELEEDPEQVIQAQALTLNESKRLLGLKGTHGLFGSDEWWENIRKQIIPNLVIRGSIKRAYISGQDQSGLNNTVDVIDDAGRMHVVGIYTNKKEDVNLFKVGSETEIIYALDELKRQPAPDGGINYSKIAIEMAVSQ